MRIEGDIPDKIDFIEVGPRDGLQNLPQMISTEKKVELVERIVLSGVKRVEVTSFSHPRWVPQLQDAEEVLARVRHDGVRVRVLVPNLKGLERAERCGVREVVFNVAISDTFNRRNLNRSTDEVLSEIERMVEVAGEKGMKVTLSLSTAFGCPYEGKIEYERVSNMVDAAEQMGIEDFSIADTVGMADPRTAYIVFRKLKDEHPRATFSAHFHDTRGSGLANALAALVAGVKVFEGSVGGLGGCPFAPGAAGNLCSEDLLYMFTQMGIETGVDVEKLAECSRWMESEWGLNLTGRLFRARGWRK